MLQMALEDEVEEYVKRHRDITDDMGKRLVVKNGYKPQRSIITGMGPLSVKQTCIWLLPRRRPFLPMTTL